MSRRPPEVCILSSSDEEEDDDVVFVEQQTTTNHHRNQHKPQLDFSALYESASLPRLDELSTATPSSALIPPFASFDDDDIVLNRTNREKPSPALTQNEQEPSTATTSSQQPPLMMTQEDNVYMVLSDDELEATQLYTSPPKTNLDDSEELHDDLTLRRLSDSFMAGSSFNVGSSASSFAFALSSPLLCAPVSAASTANNRRNHLPTLGENVLSSDDEDDEEFSMQEQSLPISTRQERISPPKHSYGGPSLSQPSPELPHRAASLPPFLDVMDSQVSNSQSDSQFQMNDFSSALLDFTPMSFDKKATDLFKKRIVAKSKESSDDLIIMLDKELVSSVGGEDIFTYMKLNCSNCKVVTSPLPISFSAMWFRRLPKDYCIYILQHQKKNPRKYFTFDSSSNLANETVDVLAPFCAIRLTGSAFMEIYAQSQEKGCNLLAAYLQSVKEQLEQEKKSRFNQYQLFESSKHSPDDPFKLILVIEGLSEHIANIQKERYNRALKKKKKNNPETADNSTVTVDRDALERYKIHTKTMVKGFTLFETKNVKHTMEFLVMLSSYVQAEPYTKITSNIDFGSRENKKSVDTWVSQLFEIPKISQRTAETIAKKYPTYGKLMAAYEACPDEASRKLLVENLMNHFGLGEGSNKNTTSSKKIGKAASISLYEYYWKQSENYTFDSDDDADRSQSQSQSQQSQSQSMSQQSQSQSSRSKQPSNVNTNSTSQNPVNSSSHRSNETIPPSHSTSSTAPPRRKKPASPIKYSNHEEESLFEDDIL